MSEETTQEVEQHNGNTSINAESMTLKELLDYRYSLPPEERGTVKANQAISGDTRKMMLWAFHCAYQDRPILMILAGSVLLYHGIKFAIDTVKILT
jgi:hypothetical protein